MLEVGLNNPNFQEEEESEFPPVISLGSSTLILFPLVLFENFPLVLSRWTSMDSYLKLPLIPTLQIFYLPSLLCFLLNT